MYQIKDLLLFCTFVVLPLASLGDVCSDEEFTCRKNGECISYKRVCDGEKNCPAGEDENPAMCRDNGCKGNLVFTTCGSACPKVCGKPELMCTKQCVPGCHCPGGRWRHYDDKIGSYCYDKETCPLVQHVCDKKEVCLHGGVCLRPQDDAPLNAYYCRCMAGWSGKNCEVPDDHQDQCTSNPCMNGGTCRRHDDDHGYSCGCKLPYTGKNCQQRRCPVIRCSLFGLGCQTRELKKDEHGCTICECAKPPTGVHPCWLRSPPCMYRGKCIPVGESYTCECYEGYTGKDCEAVEPTKHICDRQADICNKNGRCLKRGKGYVCACNRLCRGKNCRKCLVKQSSWWKKQVERGW